MENWKDIKGYEGLYQISDKGNIKSIDRSVVRENHFIKLKGQLKQCSINNRGYYSTTLCKNSHYQHFVIHKLVAIAFIPNPDNKEYINHKDGNKLNNSVDNLEWVTMSENNQHAYDIGLKIGAATGLFGALNPSSKPIYMLSKSGDIIKEFPGIHEAARELNLSATNICAAINGRSGSCGGYKWIHKIQKIAS